MDELAKDSFNAIREVASNIKPSNSRNIPGKS